MKITAKARYALRSILSLGMHYKKGPLSIKKISEDESISPEFLEQIFFKLKKAGIIQSVRGPGGGFILEKTPAKISVHEVFEAVGEFIEPAPCLKNGQNIGTHCNRTQRCSAYPFWNATYRYLREFFSHTTLEDILSDKLPAETAPLLYAVKGD